MVPASLLFFKYLPFRKWKHHNPYFRLELVMGLVPYAMSNRLKLILIMYRRNFEARKFVGTRGS